MKPTDTGKLGEAAVCRYLTRQGYTVRDRNFRIRGGEIDIVAVRDDMLCFVEVKTRHALSPASGDAAVDRRKQRLIVRAASHYLEQRGLDAESWYVRYDIASVEVWNGEIIHIDYLENAFDESADSL